MARTLEEIDEALAALEDRVTALEEQLDLTSDRIAGTKDRLDDRIDRVNEVAHARTRKVTKELELKRSLGSEGRIKTVMVRGKVVRRAVARD